MWRNIYSNIVIVKLVALCPRLSSSHCVRLPGTPNDSFLLNTLKLFLGYPEHRIYPINRPERLLNFLTLRVGA